MSILSFLWYKIPNAASQSVFCRFFDICSCAKIPDVLQRHKTALAQLGVDRIVASEKSASVSRHAAARRDPSKRLWRAASDGGDPHHMEILMNPRTDTDQVGQT